jgi:REP element-mobilizing transposase RayT
MGNTYTQMYLQFVFAVKNRESLIQPAWKDDLYKYITGIVQNNKHKLIAINGMPDHIHVFVGYKPHQLIPELLQDIKWSSSIWINRQAFLNVRFRWQEGYGSFSYSYSHIDNVVKYIMNQEKHHREKTFRQEYLELLKKFDVDYDEKYVAEDIQ